MVYVRSAFICLRAFVVFGALGLAAVAHASKLPDFYRAGVNTSGNSAKIGMTSDSAAWGSTIPISPTIGGWSQAGNYGIPSAAKGPTMTMGANGDVFFAGTKYPFQAGYTVPASNVWSGLVSAAAVVGGMAGGPVGLGLIAASTAAPYVKQWLDDTGVKVDTSGVIQRLDPYSCSAAPCYSNYTRTTTGATIYTPSTASTVCEAARVSNGGATWIWRSPWGKSAQVYCDVKSAGGSQLAFVQFNGTSTAPNPSFLPSSMDDIAPYMQAKPFDPRVVPEILAKGGDIPMPAPTITGPTALPGPSTTTKNPDGSTTVVNTTSNFTISGDTITNISNISSTTIYNSSSVVMSTSTSTVTPAPTKAEEVKTDCDKYPDSIGCSKYGTPVASDTLGRESRNVSITSVTFAGGSCPGPVTFSVFSHSYEFSYSTLCDKLAMIAPLLLGLSALLAAYIFADGFRA